MRIILLYTILFLGLTQIHAQPEKTDESEIRFSVPTKGKIASMYGWRLQKNKIGIKERKFHRGTDIAGRWGEKIYASASGEIVFVGRNAGYGLFIEIKHNDRYSSGYGHLKKTYVKNGDYVIQGEIIGEMGNTGTTFSTIGGKGIHLHFEIRDNTKKVWYSPKGAVNPLKLMKSSHEQKKYDHIEYQPELKHMTFHKISFLPKSIASYPPTLSGTGNPNTKPVVVEPIELAYKKETTIISEPEVNTRFETRKIEYFPQINEQKHLKNYALQVEAHNALLSETAVKDLEKKYQTTGIRWAKVNIKGKIWYKYTIGCFDNIDEAREYKKKLNISSAICVFEDKEIVRTIW